MFDARWADDPPRSRRQPVQVAKVTEGPRRGTLLQSAVGPPSTLDASELNVGEAVPLSRPSRLQAPGAHHLRGTALVLVGRRVVPPGERPCASVTAQKRA